MLDCQHRTCRQPFTIFPRPDIASVAKRRGCVAKSRQQLLKRPLSYSNTIGICCNQAPYDSTTLMAK